jgi:hypothetical protein
MGGPSPEKGPGNRRQLQIDTTQKRLKAIPFQMPTESSFAVNRTVVGWHIQLVEALEFLEHRPFDHQCGARNPIGVAQKLEARFGRVASTAPVPAITQPPDDPANLLQRAIFEQKPGTGYANIRHLLESLDEIVQPTWCHERVVVQEQQILPLRGSRTSIADPDETLVLQVADDPYRTSEQEPAEQSFIG